MNPRQFAALGLVLLLAWAAFSRPGADPLKARLERALAAPPSRSELLDLYSALKAAGDERGVASLSAVILKTPGWTPAEFERVLDVGLDDLATWNTALPDWQEALVRRWLELGPATGGPQLLPRLFDTVELRAELKAAPGRFKRLWLEGNWDQAGRLADVGGWKAVPMSELAPGRWGARLRLRRSLLPYPYHAVVRTAPWPEGQAVGYGQFRALSSGTVELAASAPGRPEAPAADGPKAMKLSVLVIDAATWDAVLPWVHRGLLPNFARLVREGAYGTLVSSRLPELGEEYPSLPDIYSAMTGRLPTRHGLGADWVGVSLAARSRPLWSIAADSMKSAALGLLATFPPERGGPLLLTEAYFGVRARPLFKNTLINDPQVLDFAARFGVSRTHLAKALKWVEVLAAGADTTWPPGLGAELEAALPAPAARASSSQLMALAGLLDTEVYHAAAWLAERRPPALLCAYVTGVDTAQHMYWNAFEPAPGEKPASGAEASFMELVDAYRRADAILGLMLSRSERVMALSDHGFAPALHHITLGVNPKKLIDGYRKELGGAAKGGWGLGRREGGWALRFPEGQQAAAEGFKGFLSTCRYIPSVRPCFSGLSLSREPDGASEVLFSEERPPGGWTDSIEFRGKRYPVAEWFDASTFSGGHAGNGMLALWGRGLRPGPLAEAAYLPDAAPTALYLLGLPAARDMEGRLLESALEPELLEREPQRWTASYGRQGGGWWRALRALRLRGLWEGLRRAG